MLGVLSDKVEAGYMQPELLALGELAESGTEGNQLLPRHPRCELRLRGRRIRTWWALQKLRGQGEG